MEADLKTLDHRKIALLSHFAVPPPHLLSEYDFGGRDPGRICGPGKIAQNHRFFYDLEF